MLGLWLRSSAMKNLPFTCLFSPIPISWSKVGGSKHATGQARPSWTRKMLRSQCRPSPKGTKNPPRLACAFMHSTFHHFESQRRWAYPLFLERVFCFESVQKEERLLRIQFFEKVSEPSLFCAQPLCFSACNVICHMSTPSHWISREGQGHVCLAEHCRSTRRIAAAFVTGCCGCTWDKLADWKLPLWAFVEGQGMWRVAP